MKTFNEQELKAYAGKLPPPQDGDINDVPNIQNILNKALPDFRGERGTSVSTIIDSEQDNERGRQEIQEDEQPKKQTKKALDTKPSREESILEEDPEEDKEEKRKNINWKEKAEKLERDYQETRKWGQESNKRISSYKRAAKRIIEVASLDEDAANILLNGLEELELPSQTSSIQDLVAKVWDSEIENIRKYGHYDDLEEHVKSLEHLLSISSKEEREDLFQEALEVIEDDPVLFTKKMLAIGKDHYEDVYKQYSEAGGFNGMKDYMKKI